MVMNNQTMIATAITIIETDTDRAIDLGIRYCSIFPVIYSPHSSCIIEMFFSLYLKSMKKKLFERTKIEMFSCLETNYEKEVSLQLQFSINRSQELIQLLEAGMEPNRQDIKNLESQLNTEMKMSCLRKLNILKSTI